MSHWTTIKTKMKNTDAIFNAVKRMFPKAELCREQMRGFAGNKQVVDLNFRMPGQDYDLGFKKQSDGTFSYVTDFFGSSRWLGREADFRENLTKFYNAELIKLEAMKRGMFVNEEVKNGEIKLIVRQY